MALPSNNNVTGAIIYSPDGDVTSVTVAGISYTGTAVKLQENPPVEWDKNKNYVVIGATYTGEENADAAMFPLGTTSQYRNMAFKSVTFTGNTNTKGAGGMLSTYQNNLFLEDCTLSNNATLTNGGAIYLSAWDSRIKYCTFTGNTALGEGGAIGVWSDTAVIIGSTFSNNSAKKGGAFSICGGKKVIMEADSKKICFRWQL